jgi:gliding motility-associated-like protein
LKTLFTKFAKGFFLVTLFFSFHINIKAQPPGQALNFQGSGQNYVNVPSLSFGSSWTAEAWFYPTFANSGTWNVIMGQSDYLNSNGFVVAVSSNSLFMDTPGGSGYIVTPVTNNAWTHVAATYNNGIFALYKNGTLVGVKTGTFANAASPFYIGTRNNNTNSSLMDYFFGNVDEVRVWNSTRSECQLRQYMNCEIPTTAANLVANYHFNEGFANGINFIPILLNNNNLTDHTGNGHNGTLINFALNLGGTTSNWTAPGCTAQGVTTPASASTSEIDVLGNGNSIVDGSAVTSPTNHTNFNGVYSRTFVIQNTGAQILNVGAPVITGVDANQFSVTVLPSNSLAALTGTTSFVVAFAPTSLGVKNATINIYNLDCSEPFYDFVITGTAVTASALSFDGINDYISLPNSSSAWNLNNEYTVEMWVKPNSLANQILIYTGYGCVACTQWAMTIGNESTCSGVGTAGKYTFLHDATGSVNVQSNTTATVGVWTHIAVTNTGSKLTMYINGVAQTATANVVLPAVSSTYRNIGGDPGCGGRLLYSGEMDEFRIWNKALCQSEITNYMNCQITTTATGLTANYHFNTGIALANNSGLSTLLDASSSAINGNLNNFALTGTTSNWVEPGGVTNSSTCTPLLIPDITILGNSNVIQNHNATTSSTNATNYSSVALGSSASNTFLISNFGTAVLNISSYTISGSGAANFSITSVPPSVLGISNTTNMVITFSPQSLGLKTATLSIASDDCHKNPYTFVIEGTGAPVGAGLHFDGTNDNATVASGINLNNQSFSIEFWAKPTAIGINAIAVGQGTNISTNNSLQLGFRNSNEFTFAFYANDMNYLGPQTSDFSWHHWACVYDATALGKNRFIYCDGILVLSDFTSSAYTGTGTLVIGNAGYGLNPFYGTLDELRIWNSARTQCEIQSYMNCEISGSQPSLTANYHFNQGVAAGTNTLITTLIDDNTTPKNATLNNFALTGSTSNFISLGGVTSGSITPNVPTASLTLSGNGNNVPVGVTTSTTNFTDFGTYTTRTFVITNPGASSLYLTTGYFTGANAANFNVSTTPSSTIAGTTSSSLVITFAPPALGTYSAILNIVSSDCTYPTYSFVISATVNSPTISCFNAMTSYPGSSNPRAVTSADFNGDGYLDVAMTNELSNNVLVYLGSSTGTFAAATSYGVGSNPYPVLSGDFNEDGFADLAVGNAVSNSISILLGSSSGTFAAAVNYGVGNSPQSMVKGDFNGDSHIDLVCTNYYSNNISVLFGSGSGTFGAAVNYPTATGALYVAAADFNNDSKLDLAVANFGSNNVSILFGSSTGTFAAAVNYNVGTNPISIYAVDFNSDGQKDLVTANENSSNISILYGSLSGTFSAATNIAVAANPRSVICPDFNNDGYADLAVSHLNSANISVLLGTGTGVFAPVVNYSTGLRPVSLFSSDFNNDGKADLAVANYSSNTLGILLNAPALTIVASNTAICFGSSSTLTANGASSYTWSTASNNASIAVSPASTTNYTVSGTNALGCVGNATTTILVTPATSLVVSGNGNTITNGSTATSTLNFTNFGSSTSRVFSIQNSGSGTLSINSITFTGANALQFSVSANPSTTLGTSASSTFNVVFTPTAIGTASSTVYITSSDCTNPTFSFVITASTSPASALKFDGVNDFVTCPALNLNSSFTIEFITKRVGSGGSNYLVGQGTGATNNQVLHVGFSSNTDFRFAFYGNDLNYNSTPAANDGIYHHWACVYNATSTGKNRFIYLDGVLVASDFSPSNFSGSGSIWIGQGNGGFFYNGTVDELRIWNTARSQCEIQTYMSAEIPTSASGLLANYHFNQGIPSGTNTSITTLTDAAGSNNGTLSGFALTGTVSNWVGPASIANGFTTTLAPTSNFSITGLGQNIAMGATSSTLTGTNFGTLTTRSFQINNAGTGTLNISTPYFTGPNAAQFSLTSSPLASVTTGTTSFSVLFTPSVAGVSSATLNIPSNDCTNSTFSFVITATPPPASALSFDGSYSYVEIPNSAANNFTSTNAFTVEFWAKTNSNLSNGTFVNKGSGAGQEQYSFDFAGTDFRYYILDASGFFTQIIIPRSTVLTVADGWVHLAGVYDGSSRNIRLYRNGIEIASLPTTTVPLMSNTNPLSIGAQSQPSLNAFFSGQIDELRLWNTVRSQCEIQTYMNCEIPTTASGLVGNYHFNQGANALNNSTVTTLVDASASASTGTLINFSLVTGTTSNWIAPGGVTNGFTIAIAPTSSISITGSGNLIAAGSTAPNLTNFTDFGTANTRTFVAQSSGGGTMYINAPITLSGANAADFSVTSQPSSSITTGTTNFIVAFTPTALGTRTAIVNVNSSDCAIPNYSFVISASSPTASALKFDGTDDFVQAPNIAALSINTMVTVEAWVKPTNNTGVQYVVSKGTNDQVDGQYGMVLISGVPQFHMYNTAHIGVSAINYTATPGVWTHYAGTWDGSIVKLYINGVLNNSINYSGTMPTNADVLQIGKLNASGYWSSATIDEVRIWNIARSQCEIQTFMNAEIPTTAAGLIANYHFNSGIPSGSNTAYTVLTDASVNSNHGTLTNMSLTGTLSNWVSPGAVVNEYTTTVSPSASIAITGNGNGILAGSTSPNLTNHTDFGPANTRTFVIQSSGGGTMYINAPVTLSGGNAGDFSITSQPTSSVTTGTTNFIIAFTPTALGTRTAIVNVNSSDCTSPNYSFVITGSATTGSALNMDGINDRITAPVFNTQTLNTTMQAKVFWSGNSLNQMVVYNGNSSTNGYGIYIGAAGTPSVLFGSINYYSANYTLTPNVWTSLTAVLKNGTGEFYVNGVMTNSFSASPNTPNASFNIGCNSIGSEIFNGSIDEVLLWNRSLTQCEIQAYLTCEIATSASSLVANYHFNQGIAAGYNPTVTTLTDASGNNNHLTLTNFSLSGLGSNWISQGAVISGSSCAVFMEPDINVISNAITIPDGNTVTATADNTDFGNVSTTSVTVKSYTIQNTGSGTLTVSSITTSGANASQFIVGALTPASPISPSSSAVFSVTFAPTSIGTKSATVNIINNDCDEATYDFVLSGSANVGAALSFNNSTSDHVDCGNILTASYTKEAWIKLGTSTNGNNILSGGSGVTGHALWAPGQVPYNYKLSAGHDLNWAAVQDPNSLSLNVWHHVAVTYDAPSTIMTLYKDGSVVATNTVLPYSGSGTLSIGGFGNNFTLNGSVDEVRIWNRPLCPSEILNNMNCEISGAAQGLIASYHFNQGIGFGSNPTATLLTDASGSANTGTLVNFANTGTLSNWISTSTITTGSSCTLITVPEINVVGNGTTIIDGSTTSSLTDHTDFGGICINTNSVQTYTIQNSGTGNLVISGITMSGTNASDFIIGTLSPTSPIPPSGNAVFSVTFSPTTAGTKTAIINIANNDCNESPYDYVLTGTCNALPSITASTTNSVICDGSSTTLNGVGADTYTWTGGTLTNGVAFNPSVTLTYTVTGTNTLTGCTSTNIAVQTITVNPTPTITASSSSLVLCDGESTTITASGASNYSVDTNGFSGPSTTLAPQSTAAYSITGTSLLGCLGINTVVITITVNPLPIVTATASLPVICNTATTSLIGGGADTYTWTGGAINGSVFSPTQTTTYSVTGTYTLTGCTSTNIAAQTITVDATPTITASSANTVICEGTTATLTASGASSYTWSLGGATTAIFNPTPTITTTYSVVGTSSAGCTSTNTAIETISVNPTPTVSAAINNSVICDGETVTANGSGAQTYTWTSGITDAVAFTPSITSSYSVSGTNSVGCVSANQAVISVTVNSLPSLTVSATKAIICLGESDTLNVSGAQTYNWTNGSTTATTMVSPSVTTNYTVTGKDLNGCINTAFFTQSVLPCTSDLTATATISNVTCKGKDDGQITISNSTSVIDGELTYVWSSNVPCLLNNCDTLKNLKSGTYSVTVKLTYTTNTNFVKTDSVILDQLLVTDLNGDCEIKVYSGVSANGDGINDFLIIKNIEQYPDNKVSVYNRWGQQVFQTNGYNNIDKVWPTSAEANNLPSNTYFYIIDLGNGSALIKGWVELIKN